MALGHNLNELPDDSSLSYTFGLPIKRGNPREPDNCGVSAHSVVLARQLGAS
jgi:hypothetical protein